MCELLVVVISTVGELKSELLSTCNWYASASLTVLQSNCGVAVVTVEPSAGEAKLGATGPVVSMEKHHIVL